MEELKPCPFCGKKAIITKLVMGDKEEYFGVACSGWSCPTSSIIPNYTTEDEAIEAWNRRAT